MPVFENRGVSMLAVYRADSEADLSELNDLLWEVLWKPLDLPRDFRDSFKMDGKSLEIAARLKGSLVGGLVANWTSPKEVEIRHLAIREENQKQGIGVRLIEVLLEEISGKGCARLHTIARNTSAGFFRKLRFRTAPGQPPEHPAFKKHGITFELLEKDVEQALQRNNQSPPLSLH